MDLGGERLHILPHGPRDLWLPLQHRHPAALVPRVAKLDARVHHKVVGVPRVGGAVHALGQCDVARARDGGEDGGEHVLLFGEGVFAAVCLLVREAAQLLREERAAAVARALAWCVAALAAVALLVLPTLLLSPGLQAVSALFVGLAAAIVLWRPP